jgi:hypothetical protein
MGYARRAVELESDRRYDHFELGMSELLEGNAQVFTGRMDKFIETCSRMAASSGLRRRTRSGPCVHTLERALRYTGCGAGKR